MIKRVQMIGHIKSAADLFLGLARELTMNTTDNAVRLHDGATVGGHEMARQDLANVVAATGAVDGKMTSAQAGDLATVKSDLTAHVGAASGHPVATPSADGFESAADKTKLDGIETAATIDQSAAEILAALLTVDGAGSLLDADFLDGISSAAFALDANTVSAGTGLSGGGTIGSDPTINLDLSTLGAASALAGTESVAVDQSGEKITTTQDIADLAPAAPASFPTGTAMLFRQTAAPTGWTKSTADNNKALRVVSGAAGTGGTIAFTTAFNASKASNNASPGFASHGHDVPVSTTGGTVKANRGDGSGTATVATTTTGSGSSHSHVVPLDVSFVDIIVATKDA